MTVTSDDAEQSVGSPSGDTAPVAQVLPDAIGPAFAPRPRESVVSSRFEGEVLIVDGDTGAIHVLNSTAAVIWECFDGEVTLAELAGDIAEAFGAPLETVQRDTIAVAQELGGRNLLAGVSPPVPEGAEIAGLLEVGEEMSPIRVGDAEDVEATIPRPGAKGTLLVNWSPYCGYCGKIVSDLAACAKPLSNRGIDLVLLTIGAPEDNHQMLDEHGLIPATFHRVETPEGSEAALDPFSSMGTPVAYLLDGDGKVASPLAYGAAEVPALARSAAGLIPVQEDVAPAPRTDAAQAQAAAAGERGESPEALVLRRSLPAASGVCGPSKGGAPKKSRQWAATSAYAVGEYDVGIRTDSLETDALVGQLLTEYRLDGPRTAGDNFSVVLAPDASARSKSLNLLLSADLTVVRSRSP
ncbi:MAG: PqqD family peptide modification chaperone, partial [Acidimicrobiales bacterium]